MSQRKNLKIGDFVLDPLRNTLTGPSGPTALEPKVVDVLLALAAQPGEVLTRDELIEAVWKTEFGADERVTRAISLLRKAFGDERGAARYIETVPKRGYLLVAAVETLVEDEPASAPTATALPASSPSIEAQPHTLRRLAMATAAALGIAASVLWLWPDRGADPRYAVDVVKLNPPRMIGQAAEHQAFAPQVHATLKRILASNHVLLVDGGGTPDPATKEPEFSLSVSIEPIGGRYAVDLYFENRRDNQTLWSHRFDRPLTEAESLREEAAINTAATLGCALKERRAAQTVPTVESFKIYLESCDPTEDWGARLAAARRLTKIAPADAYGHALEALANAFVVQDDLDLTKAELETHRTAARRAIARARELDPKSPLIGTAELVLATEAERWRSEEALKRASLEHPGALDIYFGMLRSSGRLKEARHVAQQAIRARRLSPFSLGHLAIIHMQLGEIEQAERLYGEAARLWPDMEEVRFYQLVNAAFYGEPMRALELVDKVTPGSRQACFRTFIDARRRGPNAFAAMRSACSGDDASTTDYLARMFAALGDVDAAYEVLARKAFDWNGATTFLFYPEMAAFRRDARFLPFIASSGLLEAWTETGHWPDFCGDQALPYDCKTEAARMLKKTDAQR